MLKPAYWMGFLFILSLAGCSIAKNQEVLTQEPTNGITADVLSYPAPSINVTQIIESYPSPVDLSEELEPGKLPVVTVNMPEPEASNASLTGVLFSYTQWRVVPKTLFYLTPGFGEENIVPPVLDEPNSNRGDISGFSDKSGNISLNNIPPGTYYLIVMAPYSWSIAEISDQEQVPRKIVLKQGDMFEAGVAFLSWP